MLYKHTYHAQDRYKRSDNTNLLTFKILLFFLLKPDISLWANEMTSLPVSPAVQPPYQSSELISEINMIKIKER